MTYKLQGRQRRKEENVSCCSFVYFKPDELHEENKGFEVIMAGTR